MFFWAFSSLFLTFQQGGGGVYLILFCFEPSGATTALAIANPLLSSLKVLAHLPWQTRYISTFAIRDMLSGWDRYFALSNQRPTITPGLCRE
jgi:hypothetical protein